MSLTPGAWPLDDDHYVSYDKLLTYVEEGNLPVLVVLKAEELVFIKGYKVGDYSPLADDDVSMAERQRMLVEVMAITESVGWNEYAERP